MFSVRLNSKQPISILSDVMKAGRRKCKPLVLKRDEGQLDKKEKKIHSGLTWRRGAHTQEQGTGSAGRQEPAGVGVSTAALQLKQRAAHDSSG